MGKSDAPAAREDLSYLDGSIEDIGSHVSLRRVDDFEVSGVVDVGSFREEYGSGVRRALRLVEPEEELPKHVEVSDLRDGEKVSTVIKDVRVQLGKSWDVLLNIAETCRVNLNLDGNGGQKLSIRRGQVGGGLVLSRENKNKRKTFY